MAETGFCGRSLPGDAIRAAAHKYDVPIELLAGVAYNEVGGDPLEADNVAYALRSEVGRNLPLVPDLNPRRDLTSFGNLSVQLRRASESLNYGESERLTENQRRMILSSLQNPSENIFVAAKHLSDLRDVDFKGTSASKLTRGQIEIIGARYNRGSELSLPQIAKDLSYGKDITKRWRLLKSLVQ